MHRHRSIRTPVLVVAGVALTAGLAGCGSPAVDDAAADTLASAELTVPATDPVVDADVVDGFDDPTSGWSVGSGVRYLDGTLQIEVDNDANPYVLRWSDLAGEWTDVHVAVTASVASGADSTGSGLGCRVDGALGYYGDLSPEGDVRITTWESGDQEVLASGAGVVVDRESIDLELRCVGADVTFIVDGEPVLSHGDATVSAGGVTLIAGGAGSQHTDVRFDDVAVTTVGGAS